MSEKTQPKKQASEKIVAVTGGAGFIGQSLLKALAEEGYQVRALQNRTPVFEHKNITPIKGSLTDAQALKELVQGADVVIHGAGLIAARRGADYYRVNTEGTRRLAQVSAYQEVDKFLLISSLSAREFELSHYGNSKKKAEHTLRTVPALKWDALRPPAVYGPGDMQFLPLMKMVKKGTVLLPAGRKARASMIYVDDLVAAIVQWVKKAKPTGTAYELDDGATNGYRWEEVTAEAAKVFNTKPRYITLPKFAVYSLSYVSYLAEMLLQRVPQLAPEKARQICYPDWVCRDNSLQKAIGWKPKVTVSKGIPETIRWYQQQGLI